jgi:hypothetical protein
MTPPQCTAIVQEERSRALRIEERETYDIARNPWHVRCNASKGA